MALHGTNHRLRWSDFRQVAESPDGEHDANTSTRIDTSWSARIDARGTWRLTRVSVSLSLNRSEMWVVRGKAGDRLLAHEQVHFEISAIAARTLEAKLMALTGDQSQAPSDAVDAAVIEVMGETTADGRVVTTGAAQAVQNRYDEDLACGANHGLDRPHQAMWETRVANARRAHSTIFELNSCPREEAAGAAAGGH